MQIGVASNRTDQAGGTDQAGPQRSEGPDTGARGDHRAVDPALRCAQSRLDGPRNPATSTDETRTTIGQMLCFLGLMIIIGAALTIISRAGHANALFNPRHIFFAILMPVGLGIWWLGRRLIRSAANPADDEAHDG